MKKQPPVNFFSKCGVEATWQPNFVPKKWEEDSKYEGLYEDICSSITDAFTEDDHPWFNGCHRSDRYLETPSPTYETAAEMLKAYRSFVRLLKPYGFIPSAANCLITEGSCHININLKGVVAEHIKRAYCWNMVAFLNANPWLAWLCLSPYDKESAHVRRALCLSESPYFRSNKGDALHFRHEDVQYVEMRFFMQPRTDAEFVFHLRIAHNLAHHIFEITKAGEKLYERPQLYATDFYRITYGEAVMGCENALRLLNCDPAEAHALGKFELMALRFQLGKSYLV